MQSELLRRQAPTSKPEACRRLLLQALRDLNAAQNTVQKSPAHIEKKLERAAYLTEQPSDALAELFPQARLRRDLMAGGATGWRPVSVKTWRCSRRYCRAKIDDLPQFKLPTALAEVPGVFGEIPRAESSRKADLALLSRQELIRRCQEWGSPCTERGLVQRIGRLRRRLNMEGLANYLRTCEAGYQLCAPVNHNR